MEENTAISWAIIEKSRWEISIFDSACNRVFFDLFERDFRVCKNKKASRYLADSGEIFYFIVLGFLNIKLNVFVILFFTCKYYSF
ncbi:hypothetical protein BA724_13965 [Domibacillus iocasae]|uniref:Uncharacterized protein n=1 Tax=Domibacillus iocasae TaxID=1714016 RepID=A0A1E7DJU0_9BACI|nr:hypothetical protein BA724_13965 [Domibacillus iocasae]